MFKRIKMIGSGLLTLLAALFYVRSTRLERKKNVAEVERDAAERKAKVQALYSKQMAQIVDAQSTARNENKQAEVERNEKPKNERRSGRFGTANRLRK